MASSPLQCPTCKDLLLNPVTLPCGFSLCQRCLPPLRTIDFQRQLNCPFPPCTRGLIHPHHTVAHLDVSLQNITTLVRAACSSSSSSPSPLSSNLTSNSTTSTNSTNPLFNILSEEVANARQHCQPDTLYYGQPTLGWEATLDGLFDPYEPVVPPTDHTSLTGSPSRAHYNVIRDNLPPILASVQSKVQQEIECQVCFLVFCHPITTECGHTFCKACLIRSLDHKQSCPLCRTQLPLHMHFHNQTPNKSLVRFIQYLARLNTLTDLSSSTLSSSPTTSSLSSSITFPATSTTSTTSTPTSTSSITATSTTIVPSTVTATTSDQTSSTIPIPTPKWNATPDESENEIEPNLAMTPLFVNSLIFPKMPCYLLVFEPRYRRLLRNVLKTESKLFGMVLPPQQRRKHQQGSSSSEAAWEPSMEYGNLLKVVSFEPIHGGRALVETVGVARFQILTYSMLDGYYTATAIDLIYDIPEEMELGLEKATLDAAAHERALKRVAEQQGSAAESNEEQDEVDFILGSSRDRRKSDTPSSSQSIAQQQDDHLSLSSGFESMAIGTRTGTVADAETAQSHNGGSSSGPRIEYDPRPPTVDVSTLNSNGSRIRSTSLLALTTSPTSTFAPLLPENPITTQVEDIERPGTGQWGSRRLLHATADLSDLHKKNLDTLSRRELMDILLTFVAHMQDRLGPLATQRLQREFGEMIEDNGQYFSFWVASILPVRNYQKYELLKQTSVRQRLLTVVGWIRDIETRNSMSVCTIS
ncbi:hypothetical protein BGZ94_001161 [Podila epigama]|nr:hypothetical protein BGZ94_001161 [Podila epigama]